MASPRLTTTFLLLVLSSVIATYGASDLQSDRATLLTFHDAFRPPRLRPPRVRWNATTSPCEWTGVGCVSGRVVTLHLHAMGLVGPIPTGSIGNLTALRTLALECNSISGPLPSNFTGASSLRDLYLENNSLSGEFPRSLSALRLLVRLNLEFNNFSGELPDIDLPRLGQFNVSYNHLSGAIPSGFHKWPAISFLGMPLCGGSLTPCTDGISPAEAPAPHRSTGPGRMTAKLSGGAIAGIIIAAVFTVTVFTAILYYNIPDLKMGAGVKSVFWTLRNRFSR